MGPRLETIYREHRQGLFSLALSVTGEPGLAEDAVHDAFVKLCRRSGPSPDDGVAYAHAAVRHAAIDRRRKRGPRSGDPASLFNGRSASPAAEATDPADHAADAETQRRLRDAIDALPGPARDVIVMRVFGQLTFEQIARALGEPLGTVTCRYQRTVARLRQQMEQDDADR